MVRCFAVTPQRQSVCEPDDASTTRRGLFLQRLARPGGIVFPTAAETVALLPASLSLVESRVDGIVFRLTARKVAG